MISARWILALLAIFAAGVWRINTKCDWYPENREYDYKAVYDSLWAEDGGTPGCDMFRPPDHAEELDPRKYTRIEKNPSRYVPGLMLDG